MTKQRARDAARRLAFTTLYEASLRTRPPETPSDEDAAQLVRSVEEGYDELVALIEPRLKSGWRFDRLSLAERLILLLGTAEIVATDRAFSGIVSAWTHLADLYGEPASHRFVNAVLANVASARPA